MRCINNKDREETFDIRIENKFNVDPAPNVMTDIKHEILTLRLNPDEKYLYVLTKATKYIKTTTMEVDKKTKKEKKKEEK